MGIWLSVVGILVSVIACGITSACLYLIMLRRRYSHIPGPMSDSFFLGIIPTFKKYQKEGKFFSDMVLDWCTKYGKTFKIEFVHKVFVFTADPQAVREVMITGNHPKPKYMYQQAKNLYWERFLGKGLVVESDQKVWVERRTLMNPCFQKSYLRGLEAAFNTEVDILINRMVGFADGKTKIRMLEEFNHLTLDVIGKIAFGMQLDSIENRKSDSEFTKAISLVLKGVSQSVRDPLIEFKVSKWKFIRDVRKALRFLRVFSRRCFKDRMAALQRGDYTPDDILNHIVKMKLENPKIEEEVILDDILTFFIAGQETTANMLSFAMVCLWKHKDVLERLRAEVNEAVGVKPYISFDDVSNMTYLDMVVKETLRLYPPAANTFRETKYDLEISGYRIPKGSYVMMSTYVSSRLADFFPDPLKFDPERFNPKNESSIPSYTYFPFMLGPRTCIGRNFAEIEGKIILTKIMQRFNFEMDPDQSFDIEETGTLKPKGGVICTLTLCDN